MIKVFTTKVCPYCITLKEFLKQNKVEFQELDVAEDEQAREEMISKSGQLGVPVIEANGQIIIGFDRERICKILDIK